MKKRGKRERSEMARSKAKGASAAEETAAVMPHTASDSIGFRGECLAVLLLVVAVLIPYGQVLGFDFLSCDDNAYVFENPQVMAGLNAKTFVWAFTNSVALYFHPLTWLSHILDCQMYGLNAGGHHFTSLLIHTINTVLLFWVLRRMTGQFWPSVFAAALFGVHPLHVESVAWVSERKDVLSALFWIAGMGAYTRFVRVRSVGSYLLVVATFLLALMSKPMVVTFPFALLLLDYWPLNRFSDLKPGRAWFVRAMRLALEKAPLFALCIAGAASTFIMQQAGGSLEHGKSVVLHDRIANAFVAYAVYIGKTIVPFHLAPFYPHPGARPFWQIGLALLVLSCITLPVVAAWRKRPYLIVGWLWFIGTLIPVIELVQAGGFAYADRYTYIPSVGLSIMLFYGVADAVQWGRLPKKVFVGVGTAWMVLLMICTAFQAHLWRDTISLMEHTLQVTSANYAAHSGLGVALMRQKKFDEAKAHFLKALEIMPDLVSHYNLGVILLNQGNLDEAKVHFLKAIEIKPDYVAALNNLGIVLLNQGQLDEAKRSFLKAIELEPDSAAAHVGLGCVLMNQKRYDECKVYLLKAIELEPDFVDAHINLGVLLRYQGHLDEAKAHFQKALEIKPDSITARKNLEEMR